ncbi:hypothetical protein [Nitrobacter vulgaris]|nr:hypothetical protein [Nitrobacter vulgaris]
MKLPPDVSQADFDAAVEEFRKVIGAEWVFTGDECPSSEHLAQMAA